MKAFWHRRVRRSKAEPNEVKPENINLPLLLGYKRGASLDEDYPCENTKGVVNNTELWDG